MSDYSVSCYLSLTDIMGWETVRVMTGFTVGDLPMLGQAGPGWVLHRALEAWFVERECGFEMGVRFRRSN